jgi:putative two-component system response regulator
MGWQMSKILIVDDMPKNIQMAMNMLKYEGHHMFYAKNGEMALKLVKEHDYDLILLDIMMPDINGYEVCKILKNDIKTSNIPIIFLSGRNSTEDIQKAYEIGGIDYIIKPFIDIELKTKVALHTELSKLRKELK